jgi:POT family proton-dependent oligopeptide transporter
MSTEPSATNTPFASPAKGWFGHPIGLSTLFFTEMWERFSYYGMRALLILYMVAPADKGGLGFDVATAGTIYGYYTMLVYATGIPGGILADRWLGQYGAIFLGGIFIAAGQFSLVIPNTVFFYLGLGLIVFGSGLLKPNMSSMVGSLYEPGDPRRDGGFSIYYLGINLGAFVAPFICGTLAQTYGWHWGFAAAGIGMLLGLIQFRLRKRHLQPAIDRIAASKRHEHETESAAHRRLTAQEWKRLAVVASLFLFSAIFFAAFEQAGSSLNLFADRMTRLNFFHWTIRSTWFQAVNPLFILIFAPVFSRLWIKVGKRQPSSPAKFVFGLILLSLGFLLLVPAANYAQSTGHKVSPLWLVGVYLFCTLGELCLSPVGLSMVTKLAPAKMVGSIMGFWFLASALGNFISGKVGGTFETLPLWKLFGIVFIVPFCAGLILLLLVKPLKRLMGGVN